MLAADADGARFESDESQTAEGDAVITTDAANRLLSLWGRRSAQKRIAIEADPDRWTPVASVLWPNVNSWG